MFSLMANTLLKQWRLDNGLSLRDAAKLFGIASAGNLQRIESGATYGLEVARRIWKVTTKHGPFSVTPTDLMIAWENAHPPKKESNRGRKINKGGIQGRKEGKGREGGQSAQAGEGDGRENQGRQARRRRPRPSRRNRA